MLQQCKQNKLPVKIYNVIRSRRDDIEEEDDQESYFNYIKNAPVIAYPDDEEEIEYDSDGNPIAPEKSKVILRY